MEAREPDGEQRLSAARRKQWWWRRAIAFSVVGLWIALIVFVSCLSLGAIAPALFGVVGVCLGLSVFFLQCPRCENPVFYWKGRGRLSGGLWTPWCPSRCSKCGFPEDEMVTKEAGDQG